MADIEERVRGAYGLVEITTDSKPANPTQKKADKAADETTDSIPMDDPIMDEANAALEDDPLMTEANAALEDDMDIV